MFKLTITKEEARNFLIRYHGLDNYNTFVGEQGILDFIKRVGCIQYDPLNVVGRNADLVLQARIKGYTSAILEKLIYTDRSLIDGWDKMMAIHGLEDWPYFSRIRIQKGHEVENILKHRSSLNALNLIDEIREIIKNKGPVKTSGIKLGETVKGRWGHRNLSSAAMDYMFNVGELGISLKRGTQKVFDFIVNLLPEEILSIPDPFKNEQDFLMWYVKRRIGGIGLLWNRNGGGWLGQFLQDKAIRTPILQNLLEAGSISEINIDGIDEVFYIRKEDQKLLVAEKKAEGNTVRILAPLDNLLWDRDMVDKIFGFKYSWEVYLPQASRKYGYYVLPILYNNRLVARFEPEKQRGKEPLKVKKIWWEDSIDVNNQIKADLSDGLQRFAEYLGTDLYPLPDLKV